MLTFWEQLSDARLIALYAVGFLVMGAFVTTYNYVTYHLLDAPYRLSQSAVGLIFIVYVVGIFASAWIGARADRVGRGRMLLMMIGLMLCGVGLTLLGPLVLVIVGMATIARESYPDHTAWDKNDDHFDAASTRDNPRWFMVDIRLEQIFKQPVTLAKLRGIAALKNMELLRKGSRLSVQPVRKSEFEAILKLAGAV